MGTNMSNAFGGIKREQKPEDVLIGSFAPLGETTPATYMPAWTGTIEMQSQTPSCGAHASQAMKQVLEGFRGSPEYLWKRMRVSDKLSPEQGSTMLTIMQVLAKSGICSYNLLPNNANVPNAIYADPTPLTPTMDTDALNHRIGTYAFTFNPTFQQIKDAIYLHKSVILLLEVGAEFWTDKKGNGSWAEKDILPLDPKRAPITSGHFMEADSFDENFIHGSNEWSDAWGAKGRYYFGADYAPRVVEMGTIIDTSTVKYIFTKTLKLGSTGYDVKQLQTKLGITADGIFGTHTKYAVTQFQVSHKLVADGIVGPMTNIALNQ